MPREKEAYRDTLESLLRRFPDREAITVDEAAEILHMDRRILLADKNFPTVKVGERRYRIPLVRLARWMS